MRLLAFDTSTDRMSIAVGCTQDGVARVWSHDAEGGAQASRTLVPAIQALLVQADLALADLDAIVFGRGPGAFTGLRTACAVAQGLALGARVRAGGAPVPVLPLDSLLVVAEQARHSHAPEAVHWQVLAMLDARMDEVYAGAYRWEQQAWQTLRAPALVSPQDVAVQQADQALAGNVFANYGARLPSAAAMARVEALPDARAMLRLAPRLLAAGQGLDPALALPVYIRDKVASTTAERAAAHAPAATPTPVKP
jgi:tRNA threonylcarbamoyladenosine biosynthesis protein TsaB